MLGETVLQSLRHVWLTLESAELPMAIMGGIALAAWKHVRATKDVDLLVQTGATSFEGIQRLLNAAGVRTKRSPPGIRLGQLELVQFVYEPPEALLELEIDILLAQSEYHRHAIGRRVLTRLPNLDIAVAVLACEDLILHKLLAGRLIDRADAAALVRANRDTLDRDYLADWGGRLGLVQELEEVQREAFSGFQGH